MVIFKENQGYSNIIGSSQAPYINSLASTFASATQWYGLSDISLADHVALISGKTGSYSSPTLVGELATVGISWKAYMEDMPFVCYTGGKVGYYEKGNNPFVYFMSITSDAAQCGQVLPFADTTTSTGLVSALTNNTASSFMFAVPNICDDMHTSFLQVGWSGSQKAGARSQCHVGVSQAPRAECFLDSPQGSVMVSPAREGTRHGRDHDGRYVTAAARVPEGRVGLSWQNPKWMITMPPLAYQVEANTVCGSCAASRRPTCF